MIRRTETSFVIFYVVDECMRLFHLGARAFLAKRTAILRSILLIGAARGRARRRCGALVADAPAAAAAVRPVMVHDIVFAFATTGSVIRFSRPLRPLLLMIELPPLRRLAVAMLKTVSAHAGPRRCYRAGAASARAV